MLANKRQHLQEEEEELYRGFLHDEVIESDDEEYVSYAPEEEEEENGEYEIHTRSMQPIEFMEIPENYEEEDEEEEELPLWHPVESSSSSSGDEGDEGEASSTKQYQPWNMDLDEEEEDDDDEEYREEDNWQHASSSEEEDNAVEEEDLDKAEEMSKSELLELSSSAKTLLLPEDIKRIRQQVRTHVQLLCQVLMFSASGGKKMMFQMYCRLLQDICDLGRQNQLEHSIFKSYVAPLQKLLERAQTELLNVTPLVKDKPTWQMPIVHRFQQILTDFAPQLGFSATLYPKIPKQKQPIFSSESEEKRKNWRTWTQDELQLVVMGFDRFGNERGLTNHIYESLLPSRQPHTITRLICEAQGKKKEESRFSILLDCLKTHKDGGMGAVLSDNERRRLLHGVAVQCRTRGIVHLCDINYEQISIEFLPHRSACVLKNYFEHISTEEHKRLERENVN